MQSFETLSRLFSEHFGIAHFPDSPASLYEPCNYFVQLGGKRIRPVVCLMANELFDEIHPSTWNLATAIELFHNFTLIHDDIMDASPLRRGKKTLHLRNGHSTALLAGDVMLVTAYEYLNKLESQHLKPILKLFNRTAKEVCEGQQLDMDFEKLQSVSMEDYVKMIELKTSVLLAASLHMGAIMGGAGSRNQQLLYEFGKNLGIAFQIQDDYLDAFGDPAKTGKQPGGDIISNKKTFLLIRALETGSDIQRSRLAELMNKNSANKVEEVVAIYTDCGCADWARSLREKYFTEAERNLEDIAVISARKEPFRELARFLVHRDY